MPKLLVIDKSRFQGIAESQLIEFVKNCNVVLPHVLCVECLVSEDLGGSKPAKDPIALLNRIDRAVKSGALVGCSSGRLFQEEKSKLSRVDSIVDTETTLQFREGILSIDRPYVEAEAAYCRNTFIPAVKLLFDTGKVYFKNIEKKGFTNQFRDEFQELPLTERLEKWLQVVEQMRDPIVKHGFSRDIADNLRGDWFTWHMARLYWCWGIEWACKRSCSGPSLEDSDISNDLYDIEYVTYLSRADGILTGDNKLVKPLAKAAFPDKDVFDSFDEVPEEYLGNWT